MYNDPRAVRKDRKMRLHAVLQFLFILTLSALKRSHPMLHKPHSSVTMSLPRVALFVTQHGVKEWGRHSIMQSQSVTSHKTPQSLTHQQGRGMQLSMQSSASKGVSKVTDILMGRVTKAALRTTQDELVKLFEIGHPKVSNCLTCSCSSCSK